MSPAGPAMLRRRRFCVFMCVMCAESTSAEHGWAGWGHDRGLARARPPVLPPSWKKPGKIHGFSPKKQCFPLVWRPLGRPKNSTIFGDLTHPLWPRTREKRGETHLLCTHPPTIHIPPWGPPGSFWGSQEALRPYVPLGGGFKSITLIYIKIGERF